MRQVIIKNKLNNIDRKISVGWWALIAIMVWGPVAQMVMLLFKYAGLPYIEASDVMKTAVALVILISVGLGLRKIDRNIILASLVICIPIVVGLIRLAISTDGYYFDFFLIHLTGSVLIASVVMRFSMAKVSVLSRFVSEIDRSVVVALVVTALYLAIYSVQAISDFLYFGPSTGILLIAFPWFIVRNKIKLALFCVVLIFLGGKRAVMVSMIFEAIILWSIFGKNISFKLILQFMGVIFSLVAFFILIFSILPDFDSSLLFEFWDLASGRVFGSIDGFADDPNKISSGRFAEIEESFMLFTKSYWNVLFGLGFGWSFFWIDEALHFLHFSPLNFLYQYGLLISILMLLVFLQQIYSLYRYIVASGDRLLGALFVIFLGQVVEGFFSFMYVVNPFMWCVLGAIFAARNNKYLLNLSNA